MSSEKRLQMVARMLPAAVAVAMIFAIIVGAGSGCGKSIYSQVTNTGSPTPTATAGTGAFLYASNFNDGKIAEFKRDVTTGALTTIGTPTTAGKQGVEGLTVTPDNRFLYAADSGSNKVYQFRINSSGSLSRIGSGSIAAGTEPVMIAVDPTVTWAFATNQGTGTAGTGSISQYSINSSNGALTANGSITNYKGTAFGFPFGIVANPSGGVIYVSDNHAGFIYVFTIGTDGKLSALQEVQITRAGAPNGNPGLMVITSDPGGGTYLLVPDTAGGQLWEFTIQPDGSLLFAADIPGPFPPSMPIGIAAANKAASINSYILTANKTGNYAYWYLRSASTVTPGTSAGPLNAPVGMVAVVNPQGSFAYAGESGSGTVAELQINGPGSCGTLCFVQRFATESSSTGGTQYLALTN